MLTQIRIRDINKMSNVAKTTKIEAKPATIIKLNGSATLNAMQLLRQNIEKELINIIDKICNIKIHENNKDTELEINALYSVEILMDLEEAFPQNIPLHCIDDDDFTFCTTFNRMLQIIYKNMRV